MMTGIIGVSKDEQKGYAAALTKALAFLRTQDFRNMPEGRHDIDGDKVFALLSRYTTRPQAECVPEAHRRFVDVQYVAEGEEFLGWCPMSPDLAEMGPYDEEKDIIFYRALIHSAQGGKLRRALPGGCAPSGRFSARRVSGGGDEGRREDRFGADAAIGAAAAAWEVLMERMVCGHECKKTFCGEAAGVF